MINHIQGPPVREAQGQEKMRPGQTGAEDLVIMINYEQAVK